MSITAFDGRQVLDAFRGFKQSGLGRELGPDAVSAFTETKNVFISTEE
jgi:acyl-CoA reductase-like NAD-dependent aldehyde dehydrogenase